MKQIFIADNSICNVPNLGFKEKIGIARYLENIGTDIIEVPAIENEKEDSLLVRTMSSFVTNGIISVGAGKNADSVRKAADALSSAKKGRIRIELPVSSVGMEYTLHKKGQKMIDYVGQIVTLAATLISDVEFVALDATRAEDEMLKSCIKKAAESGASTVTLSDDAGCMLPDDFAKFVSDVTAGVEVVVGVNITDKCGMATAAAAISVKGKATLVKASTGDGNVSLESFAGFLRDNGENLDLACSIKFTELHRTVKQILQITTLKKEDLKVTSQFDGVELSLDASDDIKAVEEAVRKIGYDLSPEDIKKVYDEFTKLAEKKIVKTADLEAIVASSALSVPETYKLSSYVLNNGNIIGATAHITLDKNGKQLQGVCIGDGPIDASFRAISQIIGHSYELDDFSIKAVTEGQEAVGFAVVILRANGKKYGGQGISTDIIGASIKAYINAVNKIIYEES